MRKPRVVQAEKTEELKGRLNHAHSGQIVRSLSSIPSIVSKRQS